MDIGVVVGRFQIDKLHSAHQWLLQEVRQRHKFLVVIIGVSPLRGTNRDPLSYNLRHQMIREQIPDAIVLPLHDHFSDEAWSKNLDRLLTGTFEKSTFTLYCGRDGFNTHYTGKLPIQVLTAPFNISSTELRKEIGNIPQYHPMFRAGIIHAIETEFKTARPAVDIAMIEFGKDVRILLGRKDGEDFWRLPGGMVDPSDDGYEMAARRELYEETLMVSEAPLEYVGSYRIPDWRMKGTGTTCISTLFVARYSHGMPKGSDDLVEARFFPLTEAPKLIGETHKNLLDAVIAYLLKGSHGNQSVTTH